MNYEQEMDIVCEIVNNHYRKPEPAKKPEVPMVCPQAGIYPEMQDVIDEQEKTMRSLWVVGACLLVGTLTLAAIVL